MTSTENKEPKQLKENEENSDSDSDDVPDTFKIEDRGKKYIIYIPDFKKTAIGYCMTKDDFWYEMDDIVDEWKKKNYTEIARWVYDCIVRNSKYFLCHIGSPQCDHCKECKNEKEYECGTSYRVTTNFSEARNSHTECTTFIDWCPVLLLERKVEPKSKHVKK